MALHVVFAELDRTASSSFGVNLLSNGSGNTQALTTTGQFTPPSPIRIPGSTFNLADALNVFAFRPDLNIGATIEALEGKGVLQILAEPNLVASEGKEAHFTVGGELPIPVPQAGAAAGGLPSSFANTAFG